MNVVGFFLFADSFWTKSAAFPTDITMRIPQEFLGHLLLLTRNVEVPQILQKF